MSDTISVDNQLDIKHPTRSAQSQVSRIALWIGLGTILLLAGSLRFYHLDGYGLWSDEFVTLMIVSTDSYIDLVKLCFKIPQPIPPLYFLLNKTVFDFFTPGEVSLRLLSALASLLTVYCVFEIGKRLLNAEVGFYAALLCAVNTTQIVYAQNARPYALCLLLSAISMISFWGWLKENKRWFTLGYLASTGLLLYTHYIFILLPCIQTAHFFLRRFLPQGVSSSPRRSTRSWLILQVWLGVLLLPLLSPLWSVVLRRQSLNWERRRPKIIDFLMFLNLRALLWAIGITFLLWVVQWLFRVLKKRNLNRRLPVQEPSYDWMEPLCLLLAWCFIPPLLFYLVFHFNGLNLFVERYLIMSSIPAYLLIPVIALTLGHHSLGRVFLGLYLVIYIQMEPAGFFFQKKEFSQGVPGGSEWRESLEKLQQPNYMAPLFLFQSPFIESNELNYEPNSVRFDYFSAPLLSFYMKQRPARRFLLLPHYWWIDSAAHREFKTNLSRQLASEGEFVLLSTEEFWDNFEPWFRRANQGKNEVKVIDEFNSCGALRLRKIGFQLIQH
jgi:Dolichyl-phosphate-mannose-protein mannosyltransferase